MTNWHDFLNNEGKVPPWPYPVDYEKEREIEADVLVIGGGIAGCWAAISAARKGARVVLVEKGDTVRSGSGGLAVTIGAIVPLILILKLTRMNGLRYVPSIQELCRLYLIALLYVPTETVLAHRLPVVRVMTRFLNWSRWVVKSGI